MLEIRNVSKVFNETVALNNVSFNIYSGSICGLLGLNGAGKSTLMKIICGLSFPTEGGVYLDGEPITNESIGFMIESPAFHKHMTGRQNLLTLATLYDGVGKERVNRVLGIAGLGGKGDLAVRTYSMGMKQRLYFAYAILQQPKVLILDEPFNGIDPVSIKLFKDVIRNYAKGGGVVMVSGHVISEISNLCDSVRVINNGELVYQSDDIAGMDLEAKFLSLVSGEGNAQ